MGNLIVYKASAGSGKTYNLALEYIKLAVQSSSPTAFRNILAVTFTNKATAEMKERILLHLFNLAHGGLDPDFLCNLMGKLADDGHTLKKEDVCQRAGRTLQAILHDYDHFRVETIDSFFQSLLTNLAHELNLPRTFRVDLNDSDVIKRAVEKLMKDIKDLKSAASKAGALKLVMDYVDENIEEGKKWSIVKQLFDFARKNMHNETYIKNEEELSKALKDEAKIGSLRKYTQEADAALSTAIQKTAKEALDFVDSFSDGAKHFSFGGNVVKYLKDVLDDKLKMPGNRMANQIADPEKFVSSANKKKPGYSNDAEALSRYLKTLQDGIVEYGKTINTGRITLSKLRPMRLLQLIEGNVNDINNEANRFMLSKTPELFSRIVTKDDAPFVFERVGTTFNHIMIDEFQDTSRMQWDNFHTLLVENLANGKECMLVGDTKQSIYRWRGGDWSILEGVGTDPDFHSKKFIPLNRNFRSKRNIVEFNNAFFPLAAQELDNLCSEDWKGRIPRIYEDVEQEVRNGADGGWVRVALAKGKPDNKVVWEDVYTQIVRLHNHAGVAYRDIGILVRNNRDGAEIIEYFSQKHSDIPINSDEAYKLSASPAVMTLVCTLRYICHPDDPEVHVHLLTALGVAGKKGEFPADFKQTFANVAEHLPEGMQTEEDLSKLKRMPLYELCQHLIATLSLTSVAKDQSAYLFYFLDAVLDFLEDKPSDLELFLEHWDTTLCGKSTTGDTGDCIYVMTIHKSKGLARHTILIPFCEWDLCKFRADDIIWNKTPGKPYNVLPVTSYSPTAPGIELSLYNSSVEEERVQQYIDNLNTLYVAFTRSKQNLLIWSRVSNKGESKVGDLLKQEEVRKLLKEETEPAIKDMFSPEELIGTTFPCETVEEGEDEITYESLFNVYTSGELRIEPAVPTHEAKEESPSKNPLDNPLIKAISIELNPLSRAHVEFRQSNPAKDFINEAKAAELAENGDGETTTMTDEQKAYIDRGKLLHRVFSRIRTESDIDFAVHSLAAEGLLSPGEETSLCKFVKKRVDQENVKEWFDGSWQLFNECDILYRNDNGKVCTRRPDRVMVKDGRTVVVDFKFGNPQPEKYEAQVRGYINFLQRMGHKHVEGYLWYVYKGDVVPVK